MKKFFGIFLVLALTSGVLYGERSPIEKIFLSFYTSYFPCQQPIEYSIGQYDTQFGLPRKQFISALLDAEKIWEGPISKNLFAYSADGGQLTINLIYDERQDTTKKLQKLGITVHTDQASYDVLKAKYDALQKELKTRTATYEASTNEYRTRQEEYNKEVGQWNARGGAPKEIVDRLQAEEQLLREQVAALNTQRDATNTAVDNINAVVVALNRLATSLQLTSARFNQIGGQHGGEFEEGNYQRDASGEHVDIYQYDDRGTLVRVLAHELGHALGLDHVEDPQAIMYRLNQSTNKKLTSADIAALTIRCGIK